MVHDPLGILDALMIAVSGFFIVFLMLAVLWGIIVIVSRAVGAIAGKGSEAAAPAAPAPAPAPAPAAPAAPAAVVLEGIDETQAACVMAIVSHETGIPLDELVFKSIKAV